MKLWLVSALLLSISLPAVLGLDCLVGCSSSRSWTECITTRKSQTCPALADDKCLKLYFKGDGLEYFKQSCASEAACSMDTNDVCKKATGSFECDIYCCSGDNCNAGSAIRTSDILLLTCVLASLMNLFKG